MRALLFLLLATSCLAQTYETNNVNVQLFAGSGFYGLIDGQGAQTMFYNPNGLAADFAGNIFVSDSQNGRVRKILPDATVSTLGPAIIGGGTSIAIDSSGALWLPTYANYIFRVDTNESASQIAISGSSFPYGSCADSFGNVYFSDYYKQKIFRYSTNGTASVYVGSGNTGSVDGNGVFTSFDRPTALAIDASNNIYVWDSFGFVIRRISPNRDVVTIAGTLNSNQMPNKDGVGTNAVFSGVNGIACDPYGNLILACGLSIRKMTPDGTVTTIAGSFTQNGYVNGSGSISRFYGASGVCYVNNAIYVSEIENQRIRRITFGTNAPVVSPANLAFSLVPSLSITGSLGRTYQIQTSPDLTNWVNRASVILATNPHRWIDDAPTASNKFYRALLLP